MLATRPCCSLIWPAESRRLSDAPAQGRESGPAHRDCSPPLGDRTLMPDFSKYRYFITATDGKPRVTPLLSKSGPDSNGELVGIDAMGRMLLVADRRPKWPMDGAVGIADLLRFDRRTHRVDTVATLTQPAGEKTAACAMDAGMMRMVSIVSTQGRLAAQPAAWHNELHPAKPGFTRCYPATTAS